MNHGPQLILLALAAALVPTAACKRHPPAEASVAASTTSAGAPTAATVAGAPGIGAFVRGEDGSQSISLGDVRIETAPDLPERPPGPDPHVAGDNRMLVVLRGWAITVDDGHVTVAGRAFGAAPAGSVVRLAKDGVHVGTELRGPLP